MPNTGGTKEANERPAQMLRPREDEALRLLRELAKEASLRPQTPPIVPRSGNRYVFP